MTRARIEALLVAMAIVLPARRGEILARVDRDCASPAAWSLLAQLADDDEEFVHATTAPRRRLADDAERVMVGELLAWPLDLLIAELNALPSRTQAWERDLAVGLESAGHAA